MKKYCEQCGKDIQAEVILKRESYHVCGESIEVDAQVLVCTQCGQELFCEELDNATLLNAYNKYRRKHKLLLPEEIKKIREQYGLSQRSFAKLLNWGDKTVCRYENGSIQDKAHNSILLFLSKPENMRMYLTENETTLDEKQISKLLKRIEKLEENTILSSNYNLLNMYDASVPCEENGFKGFDYDKFCAMVSFFANRSKELLKTKLMKLLNYSDMIFYKENGISISGTKYIHFPYGPVPHHFEFLLEKMQMDHIAHIDIIYENGYEKHQVVSERELPDHELTEEELNVLERVSKKFANFGSAEISEYSHKEKGYSATKQGEVISYSYAKDIELDE